MDTATYNKIVNFIWSIADDCLRDVYVRGKYRDVILPMTVIRRLDAILEESKDQVLAMKKKLDEANVTNQAAALCKASGHSFYNDSPFTLKDLKSRSKNQQLKADFVTYIDGFSPNVQEILQKFKFRYQIDTMIENDILGAVIEKFVSPAVNLSPKPVLDDKGEVKIPGLDNHTMGVIFEELIRKFNEENNEEAGEHFTPRDVVELMADVILLPIKDDIKDGTYLCYDGACGTGGMLTVAEKRLSELADKNRKEVAIHLYGQEINAETYSIAKADLLLKGEGQQAENIKFGSTLSNDAHPSMEFDFMMSNPPYGKSWKTDAQRLGGKKDITDPRFVVNFMYDPEFKMIPRINDGQMLFLANNVSKMKHSTELGSRIAEVHNGSSLFTGDAESGESNLRRYIIESDYLEAIIALPENMFYNTGISTYIWVLTNRKEERRKGKVQLVDATKMKNPMRKNLGNKNCELTAEIIDEIMAVYQAFEETETSKIFDNNEFGHWKVPVKRPLRLKTVLSDENRETLQALNDKTKNNAEKIIETIIRDTGQREFDDYNAFEQLFKRTGKQMNETVSKKTVKTVQKIFTQTDETAAKVINKTLKNKEPDPIKGRFKYEVTGKTPKTVEYETDNDLNDTEQIPLNYPGGIETFFKNEVLPYTPDAWIDWDKIQIGYEISFTKYFFKPVQLRSVEEIVSDIRALEDETEGLLDEILGD